MTMKINFKREQVQLSHGSGGRAMNDLIDQLFIAAFSNDALAKKNDQACFNVQQQRLVMTTDSYVVSPLFFPGGDIGSLAVHGTINDLAMAGAQPLYLSVGFILEEGFPLIDLQRIVHSMAEAARYANVKIITGDTKVVERGKADGVFINTTGIGQLADGINLGVEQIKVGDHVLLSNTIGDHGVAVMSYREGVQFKTSVQSDSAALHGLVAQMLATNANLHCLRDATRGGVAAVLNEFAQQAQVGFTIDEQAIAVDSQVRSACELLGLDPLYVANEGVLIAICAPQDSECLLTAMQQHPLAKQAAIIGKVVKDPRCLVELTTQLGGKRLVHWLSGEQLPRIC